MAKEPRPKGYPKLKNYKPSQFMLPTSHYDKKKADRAVTFIENLCHTKGKWAGTPFWLLPWQEQLIRDIFGIVKPDGNRQFRTAFVEICKKVGKSELAAAVALYLLYADNEPSAEVYGAAADRQQASIVFDVAKQMVEMSPALMKRSKLMGATKRIVNYSNGAYIWQPAYQAGEPDRILGYKVETSAYAPKDGIAFGDYSYYNIGDRGNRSFKQLNELFAGNGMIGFVAKERVDGKLVLPEAVQIMKLKAD